jgi:NAD(P)-dependent dehydrogenase (short-subunit alcohol dehydrogenase family)
MGALGGKVALITGAGAGIGRGIVRRFVAEGAQVAALDISAQSVESLARESPSSVLPIVADVSTWRANREAVAATVAAYGRLDVFVGNAGIYDHGAALESLTGDELAQGFDELFAVNVKGYVLGARAALESLLKTKGSMIFTASYASFAPSGGGVLYTASKHAVVGLVRQLAYELAPDIRVNGVAPGIAPTMLSGVRALRQEPRSAILDGTEKNVPLQAIPKAEAYGGLYSFLASDSDAGHITGSVFNADSGLLIRGLARPGGRVVD